MNVKKQKYLSGWQVGRLAFLLNFPSDRSYADGLTRTLGATGK
jgi:hypothetical protein